MLQETITNICTLIGVLFILTLIAFVLFYGGLAVFNAWQARKLEKDDKLYRLKRRLKFYHVSKDCKGLNPPSANLHKAAEAYGIQKSQGLCVEDIIMKIVDKELLK